MKSRMPKWMMAAGLLLFSLALAACGGGGGGGGGDSVPTAYTGAVSQATISPDNAEELSIGAWEGGLAGTNMGDVLPLQAEEGSDLPDMLQVAQLLKAPVLRVLPGAASTLRPATTASDTIPGDCGGSAGVTIDVNESTGAFSGTFTFAGYCSQGTVLDGRMNFSGKVDTGTGYPIQFKITFSSLSILDETLSAEFYGTINFAFASDGTSETTTIDLVLVDNTALKSYWLCDYVLDITYGVDSSQVTVSGRYYDHDHGYVIISTETPLTIPNAGGQPTGGVLVFAGKDNTSARLTFLEGGTCLIQADADGDGTFEWQIEFNPNPV